LYEIYDKKKILEENFILIFTQDKTKGAGPGWTNAYKEEKLNGSINLLLLL
jgi:hypothetical protein